MTPPDRRPKKPASARMASVRGRESSLFGFSILCIEETLRVSSRVQHRECPAGLSTGRAGGAEAGREGVHVVDSEDALLAGDLSPGGAACVARAGPIAAGGREKLPELNRAAAVL